MERGTRNEREVEKERERWCVSECVCVCATDLVGRQPEPAVLDHRQNEAHRLRAAAPLPRHHHPTVQDLQDPREEAAGPRAKAGHQPRHEHEPEGVPVFGIE